MQLILGYYIHCKNHDDVPICATALNKLFKKSINKKKIEISFHPGVDFTILGYFFFTLQFEIFEMFFDYSSYDYKLERYDSYSTENNY